MDLNHHDIIKQYIEQNNFGRLVGMDFVIQETGIVNYFLTLNKDHLATPLAAHGGVIASLLDATLGVGALSTVCEAKKVVSTVEMKISFFHPALLGDNLQASSKVLKKGNRLIFMEGVIMNQKNELIAKASGTFNAYPKEKAGY